MVSGMPAVDRTVSARQHLAAFQPHTGYPALVADDLRHRTAVAQFAAKIPVLLHQQIEKFPHGAGRPKKTLFKNRPEHDDELPQVHVMLFRIAIDHERQQQHILQLRFLELFGKKLAGGTPRSGAKGVVGGEIFFELAEAIDTAWKFAADLLLQHSGLVGEHEGTTGETNFRGDLFVEGESFAGEVQLTEKPVERGVFFTGSRTVGHGVQAGFQQPSLTDIEGIEPAGQGVLFEDQGFGTETGSPDTGREPRQTTSDDNELILSHASQTGGLREPQPRCRSPRRGKSDVVQFGFEVVDATGQRGELRIFLFRYLQFVAFPQLHDNIQKIHGVEV